MRIQYTGKRLQISGNHRLIGGKIKNVLKQMSNISNLTNEFERLYKSKPAQKKKKLVLKF